MDIRNTIDKFILEKSEKDPSLRVPFAIVVLFALVALFPNMLFIFTIMSQIFNQLLIANVILFLIMYIIGVVSFLLLWLIVAGIFFFITSVYRPLGTFRKTVELTAYGFLPLIIYQIIYLFAALSIIQTIHVQSSDMTAVTTYFASIKENIPLAPVLSLINIICLIASAYIWIVAIKNIRKVSTLNAIIAVAIPVGAYIIYLLQNI